jgi:acyl-CoA synthetase (AMP-forming)/AMP-acid ligase II/NADP-dependent 3-hydroxy acid dehydrogenase YdfG/acyl carrier protein
MKYSTVNRYTKKVKDNALKISIVYKDLNEGININARKGGSEKKEETTVSEKPAIAKAEPLKPDKYNLKHVGELLKLRGTSEQKIVYIEENGRIEQTYSELYIEAKKVAGYLKKKGIKAGDKVIFQIAQRKDYIECFWACMIIGAIPAPLAILDDYGSENVNVNKLYNIWNLLDHPVVLTTEDTVDFFKKMKAQDRFSSLEVLAMGKDESMEEGMYDWEKEDTCIILFTSGSTGIPKGVCLSHRNIIGRTLGEIQMYGLDQSDVDFNWMTLTHAAGLFWSHIRSMYLDILQAQVNSQVIVNAPNKWIEMLSEFKATLTWAPNFAYALVNANVDKIKKDSDLSNLRHAFASGESNISKNLRLFINNMKQFNMPGTAIVPSFGMTETSSCITYYNQYILENSSDEDHFIPVGEPIPGVELRIVDDEGKLCREGETGHLEATGETFTKGYYNNDKANEESFSKDGYLITGDLGYIVDNQLTLTGREKDIIIINGLNYYVQDFEAAVDELPYVKSSYTVATPIPNNDGNEEIGIFFAPEDKSFFEEDEKEIQKTINNIKKVVREKCLLNPEYVIPIKISDSARTELGKKQRNKYIEGMKEGKYDEWLKYNKKQNKISFMKEEFVKKATKDKVFDKTIKFIVDEKSKLYIESLLPETDSSYQIIEDIAELQDGDSVVDMRIYVESSQTVDEIGLKESIKRVQNIFSEYGKLDKKLRIYIPAYRGVVLDGDAPDLWNYKNAGLRGLVATLSMENKQVKLKIIDTDEFSIQAVLREVANNSRDNVVIYREGTRFVSRFKTIDENAKREVSAVKDGDLVLVVGGTGGIGTVVSKWFLGKYPNGKLLMIGRAPEAYKKDTLEKFGKDQNRVMYYQADVTDKEQVDEAVCAAEKKWNTSLSGVFHLAGVLGKEENSESYFKNVQSHMIAEEEAESYVGACSAKVLGTKVLDQLCSQKNAYMMVFNSLAADFGTLALGAYSYANSLQAEYVQNLCHKGYPVKSIFWGFWDNIGMNKGVESKKDNKIFADIKANEGIRCIEEVLELEESKVSIGLNRNHPSVVKFSADDYNVQINIVVDSQDVKEKILDMTKNNYEEVEDYVTIVVDSNSGRKMNEESLHEKIREVWCDVLGNSEIIYEDNIFEIGGNSINIFQIINQMETKLNLKLKPSDLMTYSNIDDLVKFIEGSNRQEKNTDEKKTSRVRRVSRRR